MDETRLDALEQKVDTLLEAIETVDESERRNDFHTKWSEKISEIEPDQKTMYGDDYSEEDGLWDYHNKHKDDEGYNEDEVIGGYIDKVKEKFAKLKGEAATPEAEAEVAQLETEAEAAAEEGNEEAAEEKVEEAEAVVEESKEEEPDEAEVEEALKSDILLSQE
jgi:hypothetical protein